MDKISMKRHGRRRLGQRRGLTLVELAIVLVVIGILAGTTIPFMRGMARQRRIVATKKQMSELREIVKSYYVDNLSVPEPETDPDAYGQSQHFTFPVRTLKLPPSARIDKIYSTNYYAYVSTNQGYPFDSLIIDGYSIGSTGAVIISRGPNLQFDGRNANLFDGVFTERGGDDFDDILFYLTGSQLDAAAHEEGRYPPDTSLRIAELTRELPIITTLAESMAAYDDDVDGFVDEGGTGQNKDKPKDWDGVTDWTIVDSMGMLALINAGLVYNPDLAMDPWGSYYIWDPSNHYFYSPGPDGIDDGGGGDDIVIGGGGGE
jgi:prepilin-type N-terminal cleavage/methylation domain-containing protein